jgi:hypothetical protein
MIRISPASVRSTSSINPLQPDYVAKEPCNAGPLCVTEELFSRDNGFQRGQEIASAEVVREARKLAHGATVGGTVVDHNRAVHNNRMRARRRRNCSSAVDGPTHWSQRRRQSERGTAHFLTTLTENRGGVPRQVTDLFFFGFAFGFEGYRSPQGQARRPI